MNNPSPLVPQGSLDPKNKRRARVKIAVFFVLAVHGVGLLALLLQGCHREDATAAADKATNSTPAFEATNLPAIAEPSSPANAVSNTPPAAEPTHTPAAATEYAVVKNDNFSTIAKNFHVTVAALRDANPNVEPTKLQIGQKLHIPEPTKATATAAAASPGTTTSPTPATESASGSHIHTPYTVRSGDTLIRLAQVNHTTVKAIRAANNLKSDRITVGQKLKIPVKSTQNASAESRPSDVAAVPVASVSH